MMCFKALRAATWISAKQKYGSNRTDNQQARPGVTSSTRNYASALGDAKEIRMFSSSKECNFGYVAG